MFKITKGNEKIGEAETMAEAKDKLDVILGPDVRWITCHQFDDYFSLRVVEGETYRITKVIP